MSQRPTTTTMPPPHGATPTRPALAALALALGCAAPRAALPTAPPQPAMAPAQWARVAQADIAHAHALVLAAHPGVLEPDAPFHDWLNRGFREAQALARQADSPARAWAALQFYLHGYRDPHLGAWLDTTPAGTTYWAGWNVQYRHGAYRVTQVATRWPGATPQVGDVLQSCDGRTPDALLAERVAPFVDRRLHLEASRSRLALHLTNNWPGEPLWHPLRVRQCVVRTAQGVLRRHRLHWRPSALGLAQRNTPAPAQELRSLGQGTYWLHASDFMPSDPKPLAALLAQLAALGNGPAQAKALVIDTRGNDGGNSDIGESMLAALVKSELPAPPPQQAWWRVSPVAQAALRRYRNTVLASEGPDGPTVRLLNTWVQQQEDAARRGDALVPQLEDPPEAAPASADQPLAGLPFTGQLVLITDAHCVSACLDFAERVLQLPGAVHAGLSTQADTRYMDVTTEPLPSGGTVMLPLKVWRQRSRGDNQALHPRFVFEGDITHTPAVQDWVVQTVLPQVQALSLAPR